MKCILIISLILTYLPKSLNSEVQRERYLVKIWDLNFSMSQTVFYKIDSDSIFVQRISSVVGEKDSVLMYKSLDDREYKTILNYLLSHDISEFKEKYSDPLIQDGNRKKVILNIGNKSKAIDIQNCYQKDLGELFELVNKIVTTNIQIKYNPTP
jgi:hypothetical protein